MAGKVRVRDDILKIIEPQKHSNSTWPAGTSERQTRC